MIEVKDLCYQPILESISFFVPEGRALAVIGHNGAGKTTLFHVLLQLKHKTAGSFNLNEKVIGFVPERPYLEMEEVFGSFLKLHLNLIGFPRSEQEAEIFRVTTLVGLSDQLKKKFKVFSKGMLQKAVLAQAMLGSPKLMFLDEPMSGLDPQSRSELMGYLVELKKNGVNLIFSSHVMEDVTSLADDVLILDHGKQKFFGTIEQWRAL